MITFNDITKSFQEKEALSGVNLEIQSGELFVLVGPSGSGKSTTLKMLNRLIEPTRGDILIDNLNIKDIPLLELRRHMGYVLQNIALFPHMTVEENVALLLELSKWPKEKRSKRAYELLENVGMDPKEYAKRYPHELSGGEQQRVGILRALAINPNIVLMDEPFSALDPITKRQLQDLVLELHKKWGQTIVFVTHDMQEAVRLGTRIAVMQSGEIIQVGTPQEIIENPENQFVREFFAQNRKTALEIVPFLIELPDEGKPRVKVSDSLEIVTKLLSEIEGGVSIIDEDGKSLGVIREKEFMKYLASEKVMICG